MRFSMITVVLLVLGCGDSKPPATPFGKFEGHVVAAWEDDGRTMRLVEDFAYVDAGGKRWLGAKGCVVNGASIPQAFWTVIGGPFEGMFRNASVVHDVGCDQQKETWEAVHLMFHDACRCGGVSPKKAKLMYWAVYNFGPRWSVPGEREFRAMRVPQEVDEELVQRAAEYFEEHDPSLAEIETLSIEGGPLEPEVGEVREGDTQ